MRDGGAALECTPSSVVVGLSSGVDSSIAAWLLKQRGLNVVAVTLALAEPSGEEDLRSCCSPSLMDRAKAIADHLGIAHYAIDRLEDFQNLVVDYFVSEYAAGRTPNPCAKCNSLLRFEALLEVAKRLGADRIATGHYARLTGAPPRLSRALDRTKDQSYVLAEVDPALLEHCVFPLGELTKTEVKRMAADVGIAHLTSPESQEICFIPGDRYREFLKERLGERPGSVVDEDGNVIGSHTGTYNYTIGQRKGLGLGGGPPLYVSSVDAERREVVAAQEGGGSVNVISFVPAATHRLSSGGAVQVQFRSMGKTVGGTLEDGYKVRLAAPTGGVAPGQTLVLYEGDDVVLAGTISDTRVESL